MSVASEKGLNNVVFVSRIARFLNSGVALHNLMRVNKPTHEAISDYSYGSFEQLISQENIEKDAEKGDITLALMALKMRKQINWTKPIFKLAGKLKIDELNDLFTGVASLSQDDIVSTNNVDINTALPDGSTILHYICRYCYFMVYQDAIRMFDMIMTHHPRLDIVSSPSRHPLSDDNLVSYRAYPLAHAASSENLYIVRKLVEAGGGSYPPGAVTPAIHNAIVANCPEIVNFLLDNNDDINWRWWSNGYGYIDCLNVAIKYQNLKMVELLLSRGATPNSFHRVLAIDYSSVEILKVLIDAGVQYYPQDLLTELLNNDFRSRHNEDDTERMIDFLVSIGANVNMRDINGDKPIKIAVMHNPETIRGLLKHHVDINDENIIDFILNNSTKDTNDNLKRSLEILVKSGIAEKSLYK